ncbi:MAG: glycosyltransferase family 2 protein [Candidatus Marinimicrobia bacterium]|nr:glycosyltransferase family 2 protein [Candidatus Neomarinimicrobiota bacterium]
MTDLNILPRVSIVIPMYNEEQYIEASVRSVLSQEYPADKLEIHVVDSASTDDSVQVVQEQFRDNKSSVYLHNNPARKTPKSLNIGLRASTGDVVIILSGHAEMQPDFIRLNIDNLRRDQVYCSGGTQVYKGETSKQLSIGAAMNHPFGMAASYRYKQKQGYLKTVVYGAYRREVFDKIGFFEEEGAIPDDAELNCRLLKAGYKIYYDPRIKSSYHPRKTISSFARQMFKYGYYRNQMFRKDNLGISWFHFIPPAFVIVLLGLVLAAPFYGWAQKTLALLVIIYGGLILIFTLDAKSKQRKGRIAWIGLAIMMAHVAWGLGFIRGAIRARTQYSEFIR